jgi:hypothetical protein
MQVVEGMVSGRMLHMYVIAGIILAWIGLGCSQKCSWLLALSEPSSALTSEEKAGPRVIPSGGRAAVPAIPARSRDRVGLVFDRRAPHACDSLTVALPTTRTPRLAVNGNQFCSLAAEHGRGGSESARHSATAVSSPGRGSASWALVVSSPALACVPPSSIGARTCEIARRTRELHFWGCCDCKDSFAAANLRRRTVPCSQRIETTSVDISPPASTWYSLRLLAEQPLAKLHQNAEGRGRGQPQPILPGVNATCTRHASRSRVVLLRPTMSNRPAKRLCLLQYRGLQEGGDQAGPGGDVAHGRGGLTPPRASGGRRRSLSRVTARTMSQSGGDEYGRTLFSEPNKVPGFALARNSFSRNTL